MNEKKTYNVKAIHALVIDDHDPIRKAMKRILFKMGIHQVEESSDGQDAISQLNKSESINLVLTDIYMKKINGFEVLAHVRNRLFNSDIPVIIITGEANKEDIIKANNLGADDYVVKPFDAESFTQKVSAVLTKFYNPPQVLKLLRQGDRFLIENNEQEALKYYSAALKVEPASSRANYSVNFVMYRKGELHQAKEGLEKNIELNPSFYKNYALLADISLKLSLEADAIKCMKKEFSFNPKQPVRQLRLARLLVKKMDFEGAIGHYLEVLKESKKSKVALYELAQSYIRVQDFQKATLYLKRYRRFYPDDSKPFVALLHMGVKFKFPKKIEKILKEEIRNYPDRQDTYILLAKLFLHTSELDDGVRVLSKLLSLNSKNKDALRLLINIQMKAKKHKDAMNSIEKLIALSKDFQTLLLKAECLQKQKRVDESLKLLNQLMFEQPKDKDIVFLIAQACRMSQQFIKAYFMYQKAGKLGFERDKVIKCLKFCKAQINEKRKLGREKISA